MGPVGIQEMIVIFLVALVLFGPKKLPELGRTLGKALTEFRRAQNELKATFESHMRELEKETAPLKEVARDVHSSVYDSQSSYRYDQPYYDSGAYGELPPAAESTNHTPSPTPAHSSTVGASATQDAEVPVAHEPLPAAPAHHEPAPVEGTVPRSAS